MIIKLRMGAELPAWRFHDSARDLSYSTVGIGEVPVAEDLPVEHQDGIEFDDGGIFTTIHFNNAERGATCLLISFINHEGKPQNLYTDAECYLLNDNGKTIERIN